MLKNFLDNHLLHHIDKLFDRPNIKNGLIEESTKTKAKRGDYGIATIDLSASREIKKDGDFSAFCPAGEQQNRVLLDGQDTMWCVSENGVANQIETVINYFISLGDKADQESKEIVKVFKAFGLIKGKCLLDTAYIAVGSGTTKRGNSYHAVGDFVRKYGLVPKGTFPNYGKWRNWNELYYGQYDKTVRINGNNMPEELLIKGQRLLEYIDFGYAWYPKGSDTANEKGCPGTSVGAWGYPSQDGVYRPVGIPLNHAVSRPKKNTDHKLIHDSYIPFLKKLSLDYPTGYDFLMSIRLKKKLADFNQEELAKLRAKGWKYILLVNDVGKYKKGAYKILNDKLESAEIKTVVDEWVKEKADNGELEGISAENFKKIINVF